MEMRNGLSCLLVAFVCAAVGHAQQTAQVSLPQGTVTAGDSFAVRVTFDKPSPCNTTVYISFDGIDASGSIESGQTTATLRAEVPRSALGHEYKSQTGSLSPCDGPYYPVAKDFTFPARTVTVKALPPDPNQYPTSAGIDFSLTQKQFFDTKIAQLADLNGQLDTRLEKGTVDRPELREFLAGIASRAEDDLNATEGEYRRQLMRSQDTVPAFFADFHAQYEALQIELKAPIPGLGRADLRGGATLLFVQLKERAPVERLKGTWPPAATAVSQVLKDNSAAYKYVKTSGRATFDARLTSRPAGARISYKKLVDDDYKDFSSPTNVPFATFELATWDFKFHKEGCEDEPVLRIDPYQDTHPDISVEFTHCRAK